MKSTLVSAIRWTSTKLSSAADRLEASTKTAVEAVKATVKNAYVYVKNAINIFWIDLNEWLDKASAQDKYLAAGFTFAGLGLTCMLMQLFFLGWAMYICEFYCFLKAVMQQMPAEVMAGMKKPAGRHSHVHIPAQA